MADHKELSGSPEGEPVYLTVGFIRRPNGVQGEMVMDLHTDFPERMKSGRKLLVGEQHQPQTLVSVRPHQAGLLVRFKGINTPEQAGQFRNQWVYIKASEAPKLPEGKIYQHELIGFQMVDENDQPLGKLVEILETGAASARGRACETITSSSAISSARISTWVADSASMVNSKAASSAEN